MIERRAMREPRNEWKLDRTFQLTHVFATIGMASGFFMYISQMKQDIEVLKEQKVALQTASAEYKKELNGRLDKFEAKLDRLIEIQGSRR